MAYLIHTNTENMFKSVSEGIIRIPKNLIDRFDLRKLKLGDKLILFNYDSKKLYGILEVVEEYQKEKNPKTGPFNGFGKVKNHYYYYSVKVDSSKFWNYGLNIRNMPEIDLKDFFIKNDRIEDKLIKILKLLNRKDTPIIVDLRYISEHLIISVLNVENGIMVAEKKISIDSSVINLINKKVNDTQKVINTLDYENFILNCKDVGEYLYEIIFKNLGLDEIFEAGGYSITFIPDSWAMELPMEFVYCCNSFLFEKNNISYLIKNKSILNKEIKVQKVLIIADPGNRYKWSYKEGMKLYKYFSGKGIECDFISRPMSVLNLLSILENYQIVHITGHGENEKIDNTEMAMFDVGKELFQLRILNDLKKLPGLIFFNICSESLKWGFDLLKNRDIGGIIIPRWNFPDADNFDFISAFYELLFKSLEIGRAFNTQKLSYFNENKKTILPFLFSHLGDPNIRYVF